MAVTEPFVGGGVAVGVGIVAFGSTTAQPGGLRTTATALTTGAIGKGAGGAALAGAASELTTGRGGGAAGGLYLGGSAPTEH
jgi:hypothetical protein